MYTLTSSAFVFIINLFCIKKIFIAFNCEENNIEFNKIETTS